MIYLVTAHDHQKRVAHIDEPSDLQTNFWASVEQLTLHKAVLYSMETYKALGKVAMPNRVNILFAPRNEESRKIPGVLINNNVKDIVHSFSGENNDDIYIICSTRVVMEMFAKDADFIIDYTTTELGYTNASIFDTINFADYTLLKTREFENYIIRYFVREKTNFIGY